MAKRKSKKRQRMSARNRAEKRSQESGNKAFSIPEGVSLFKLNKEGTKRIDIIPYVAGKGNPYADEGEEHYERTYFTYRGIGAESDTVVAPGKTAGARDYIAEYRQDLMREEEPDEDLIKDLAPKERQLWLVFDHDEKEKGVQLWDISYHLFGKLLDKRIRNSDEEDEYEFFADPEDGLTLRLGIEEKSFAGHSFYEVSDIDFRPRKTPLKDELLDHDICLDDLLKVMDYEDLKNFFLQTSDEDEEVAPPKKRKGRKKESDEDEEEEEEPAPVKKKKGTSKKKKPEPEPEPEDEDDEDFDEEEFDDEDWDDEDDADEGIEEDDDWGDEDEEEEEPDDYDEESEEEDEDDWDDDDWDDEDEEEEEEPAPVKKKKGTTKRKKK